MCYDFSLKLNEGDIQSIENVSALEKTEKSDVFCMKAFFKIDFLKKNLYCLSNFHAQKMVDKAFLEQNLFKNWYTRTSPSFYSKSYC